VRVKRDTSEWMESTRERRKLTNTNRKCPSRDPKKRVYNGDSVSKEDPLLRKRLR